MPHRSPALRCPQGSRRRRGTGAGVLLLLLFTRRRCAPPCGPSLQGLGEGTSDAESPGSQASGGAQASSQTYASPWQPQASVFTGTLAPAVLGKSTCASAQLQLQAQIDADVPLNQVL